jgi:hypothetical protein
MPSQLSTFGTFQLWWARAFRVALRVIFVIWIVLGVLAALMSVINPLGMIPFGLVAIAGVLGLRATRPPVHEWRVLAAFGFKLTAEGSSPDESTTSTSSPDPTAKGDVQPRPNKSLERTRDK